MGFPPHLVTLMQSLYADQEAKIRWNGKHTDYFNIGKGVRQGCILSPHLFSMYTEQIMREANIEHFGIKFGGRKISNLRYADDTALFAEHHQEATELINDLNLAGKSKGLKLNAKKTKYLYLGTNHQQLLIENEEIEKVERFKYLGSIKTESGEVSTDINTRIGMAKKRMLDLVNIWKDKTITLSLKIKLLKCLVWTVMTYGAEGWTLKKKDEKRINSAEMWFYRRLLRVKWTEKRTNVNILEQIGTHLSLLKVINSRKLRYAGHGFAIQELAR